MATEKILNTRVQLKYDSYENWIATANQFKLRPGEVAVVNINGANGANLNNGTENTVVQPTILFKVGIGNPADDATWKTFNQLPWASALAADVHAWAKKTEAEFIAWAKGLVPVEVIDSGTGKFVTNVTATNDEKGHHITITRSDVDWNDVKNAPDFALAADLGDVSKLNTTAKTAVGAINEHDAEIGDLASLNTTNKGNLVSAINEALQAVEVGGTGSVVTVTKQEIPSEGSEATYVVNQGGNAVDVKIEIPKYDTSADYGILKVTGENAIKVETENQKATAKLVLDNTGNVAFSQSTAGLKAEVTHVAEAGRVDNALTIKVSGTDVVFDGSAAQTANIDAAIAAAIAEEGHPEYAIERDKNAGDYAAVYHLTKDGERITGSTINIPKDMVVDSGEVVTDPDGQPKGTYIKLVLQNVAEPLYINVGDLIEYVTSGSKVDDMVVINVDEMTHKVTATISEKSITADKLAETYTKKSEFNELFREGADLMVNLADFANVADQAFYDSENRKIVDTYKVKQTAVADPTANGETLTFIDTITQNENGVISATKKTVNLTNHKTKQEEKNFDGSTVKTVTNVKQNANGEVEVSFGDIAFPAPPKGTGDVVIATIENDIVTLNGGVKLNDHTLEDDTAKADITLAKIAKTGSIYDIKEGSVEGTSDADKAIGLKYLIFNCGTASTVI